MRAIRTVYRGPTDHKGSRIVATSYRARTVYPYDHELGPDDNHARAAELHAVKAWRTATKMTLTTSTTHADLTITASLDTETLRVSYDVDGIWAGDGRWTDRRGGSATDCGALLVRDDYDSTDAVYSTLDAGLRAQIAPVRLTSGTLPDGSHAHVIARKAV